MRRATRPSLLLLLATLALAAPARGADPGARELIADTVARVLAVLGDESLERPQRRQRIEEIAYQRFDFAAMSRGVVGRQWLRFSEEQQRELETEFRDFLAETYGERLERYDQEDVKVVGERAGKKGVVTVFTRIVGGSFDGAEIDYRMRRTEQGWRIIDVKIEGVSIVLNYRDQFKAILSRKGPEGLLEALRKKNADRVAVRES
ncbi:MAG: ABC transporter substrate-binding protein [Myxococcota bacterium]|nr:ABC transporter substrate-binding protein [Myxococcota bacterium]